MISVVFVYYLFHSFILYFSLSFQQNKTGGTTLIAGMIVQIAGESDPNKVLPSSFSLSFILESLSWAVLSSSFSSLKFFLFIFIFIFYIKEWVVVMAGVGDCKAFLCVDDDPLAIDLTSSNRFTSPPSSPLFLFLNLHFLSFFFRSHGAASDSGGRIGFYRKSMFPDLRNLHVTARYCRQGSVRIHAHTPQIDTNKFLNFIWLYFILMSHFLPSFPLPSFFFSVIFWV